MRLIDADALPRLGGRGGLVHWKDIKDAPTIDAVDVIKKMFDGEMKLMPLEVKGCATCEYENSKSRYPCFNCMYNPTLMDEWRKKI